MTDLQNSAKKYAFKLLGYRERSESELRGRLSKKGFPEDIISGTIDYLKQLGYLNDYSLAENLKHQAISNYFLGYNGIKAFMVKRGLSRDIIEESLDYNEDVEFQNIQKLIDKKIKNMGNYFDENKKRKLWNFLVRKGYSFDTIKKAFKSLNQNIEEEK